MGNGRHSGLQRSRLSAQYKDGGVTDVKEDKKEVWDRLQNKKVSNFQSMNTQDAADYVSNVHQLTREEATALGLNRNQALQSLIHDLQLHAKPIVLPDADFDRQSKTEALHNTLIFRGVGSQTAVDSIMFSDTNYTGDGIHGDGNYFSTDIGTAHAYGSNRMTAYIDKTLARPIKEDSLRKMFASESSAVQRAFTSHADHNSAISMYAIYKGYNVIHVPGGNGYTPKSKGGEDYYVALTRDILVFREHHKQRR